MIKDRMRIFLNKHPIIDYLQRVLRYANKERFRNSVLKIYNSPNYLDIHSNGIDNTGVIIYAIEYTNNKSGFYAVYKNILEDLFFCDYYGLVPVIKYPSNWLYSDGSDNPFEAFFEQPCGIHWNEVMSSRSVVYADRYQRDLVHNFFGTDTYYCDTDNEIREFGRLRKKYLHYKAEIQGALEKEIQDLFGGKKVLGVHIRGTDYKRAFSDHPTYVSVQDYIASIHKILKKGYEALFIATDDQNAVNLISEEFKTTEILFFSVFRSKGDISVAMIKSERKNHKVLLGYEVIRDVVALSLCSGFIGSMSMVSLAAQIEAVANDNVYEDKIILTKGINTNSNRIEEFEKKMEL